MFCLSYGGLLRQGLIRRAGITPPSSSSALRTDTPTARPSPCCSTSSALRSRRGGNIRSPRSWSPSGCRAPPIAATRRALPRAGGRPSGGIAGICEKSRFGYGCRRVADTLRKAAGVRIADKAALKAVREEGPLLRARRRRGAGFRMGRAGKSSPDLPARDFGAEGPMAKPSGRRRRIRRAARRPRPFARGRPLQRRGRRLLDIRVPEHGDGPRDAGGPRGRARWRRRPAAAFGHGPAAPDARLQARARADGDRPAHVPQRKPPRQREGRELLLDGQDRALLRLEGTAPTSSRGIRRSISTGIATCASRDAWTEAARSSAGSAGPLDSLLLPFRKRGPLQFWGAAQFDRAFRFVARFAAR